MDLDDFTGFYILSQEDSTFVTVSWVYFNTWISSVLVNIRAE